MLTAFAAMSATAVKLIGLAARCPEIGVVMAVATLRCV